MHLPAARSVAAVAATTSSTALPFGSSAAASASVRLRPRSITKSDASTSRSLSVLVRPSIRKSSSGLCHTCGQSPVASPSGSRSFSTSKAALASAKDPYSTLGVKKDASAKDIKRAYYGLAKKFHPDTNKEEGSKERFVEIQNAYDILSDEKKRAAYDQYGTTDGQPGFDPFGGGGSSPFGAGGFGGFQDFGGFANAGNAGSIFESLFGAFGGARGGPRGPGFGSAGYAGEVRGEDIEATVNISFEEACKGTRKKVVTNPVERCGSCTGSGLKAGAKKRTCATCNGTGTRTFVIQSGFQMASTCPSCGGAGTSIAAEDACKSCDGVGRVQGRKEVEIDLPAGVDDGFRIRKDGFGDVPFSGAGVPGSLYVRINVAPSKIWRRQGSTLFYPAQIPFHTAILGGKVRVPTLDGPVEVRLPAGTQNGEEMILQGRGVPSPTRRNQKGDLLVQFDVTMPRSLTKRQREILQQYADDVEGRAPQPAPASNTQSQPQPPPKQPNQPSNNNAQNSAAPGTKSTAASDKPNTTSSGKTEQAKGRFTIHPSSRDTTQDQGQAGRQPSTHEAGSTAPERPNENDGGGQEQKERSSSSSGEGILGKAWGWLSGKK